MANYSVWNVRMRHEWLAKPLKKKRIKRRAAQRVGLLDALRRNGRLVEPAPEAESTAAESTAAKSTGDEAAADAT